jgi:hypothetical protein
VTIRHALASSIFAELESNKAAIEADLGFGLKWERINDKSFKLHMTTPMDPGDISKWPVQHSWLLEKGRTLFKVFSARLR